LIIFDDNRLRKLEYGVLGGLREGGRGVLVKEEKEEGIW